MRAVLAILVAAATAVLLPRLALAFFAYPSADDYCIVVETRQDGFWYMQVHSYLTWTGRYSAVFLESIVSQFDIAAIYPWFAALTIVATLVSVPMLVAALLEKAVSGVRITAIATIVAAVVVGGLPSGVEAFYWMPGAASYQWGVITYLVWLSLLIRVARRDKAGRGETWRRTALVTLTVLVPGFNEVMAPITLATIVAFVAVNRSQPFASDRFMLTLLGIVIICTVIAFVAPGNMMRSSVYPELPSRHNLEYALVETARQTGRFIVRFGAYPALWFGALAAWWWAARVRPAELALQRRVASIAATLVGLISITYLTLFPVYWEYGEVNYSGEGRTYNVTYLVLIAIVMLVAGLAIRPVVGRLGERWREPGSPSDQDRCRACCGARHRPGRLSIDSRCLRSLAGGATISRGGAEAGGGPAAISEDRSGVRGQDHGQTVGPVLGGRRAGRVSLDQYLRRELLRSSRGAVASVRMVCDGGDDETSSGYDGAGGRA